MLASPNFCGLLNRPRWLPWRRALVGRDRLLPLLILLVALGGMCNRDRGGWTPLYDGASNSASPTSHTMWRILP